MRSIYPKILAVVLFATVAACSKPADVAAPPGSPATPSPAAISDVAWIHASNDADIDAAFDAARASNRPVFMYWGAKWCPPCNLVKATVFNRQDFIARSRAFVPVYIDGDSPGAQKLGARFNVSGYPTMVLFSPQSAELTRLPGEVDAARYTEVLTLGMNAQHPVKEVLARALHASPDAGESPSADDWRLLAFYSWDTDENQLVPTERLAVLLKQLADACPTDLTEIATRLRLKALAAADAATPPVIDPALQKMLLELLADGPAARAQLDLLTNYAAEITRASTAGGTAQRSALLAAFEAALERFEADTTLSRADRVTALIAQVDLAKIDVPTDAAKAPDVNLPQFLVADVRELATRFDREISDVYERQAVIPAVADLLGQVGLTAEADALLESNLTKSRAPYYLMLELASNARARGDNTTALRWYEEAFNRSEGPATRLQWGAQYVKAIIELTPQDETRIEAVAAQLLSEAAAQPDAFYERSGRSLQRIGGALYGWNNGGRHNTAMVRLQKQVDGLCGAFDAADPKRVTCSTLLQTAPKNTA